MKKWHNGLLTSHTLGVVQLRFATSPHCGYVQMPEGGRLPGHGAVAVVPDRTHPRRASSQSHLMATYLTQEGLPHKDRGILANVGSSHFLKNRERRFFALLRLLAKLLDINLPICVSPSMSNCQASNFASTDDEIVLPAFDVNPLGTEMCIL